MANFNPGFSAPTYSMPPQGFVPQQFGPQFAPAPQQFVPQAFPQGIPQQQIPVPAFAAPPSYVAPAAPALQQSAADPMAALLASMGQAGPPGAAPGQPSVGTPGGPGGAPTEMDINALLAALGQGGPGGPGGPGGMPGMPGMPGMQMGGPEAARTKHMAWGPVGPDGSRSVIFADHPKMGGSFVKSLITAVVAVGAAVLLYKKAPGIKKVVEPVVTFLKKHTASLREKLNNLLHRGHNHDHAHDVAEALDAAGKAAS